MCNDHQGEGLLEHMPGRQQHACAMIVLARRQRLTFVKRALPSASKSTLPSAPTDLPQASNTKASFTATHATVSTPFSC
jgi:sarcosine oxidase gamma subunit